MRKKVRKVGRLKLLIILFLASHCFTIFGCGGKTGNPVQPPSDGTKTAQKVEAGWDHTCALLSDGTIKCWGNNTYGQLGNGTNISYNTPVSALGINNTTSISAGYYHTCALLSDGIIKCWGRNSNGQLGNGTTNTSSYTPVSVSRINNATSISGGGWHTCAGLSDGSVKCWGWNGYGQLGNGTNTNSNTPVSVSGINNATSISAGGIHTCTLLSDGSIKCWGWNYYGQIGNGTYADLNTPVSVSGINNAVSISAGLAHTCAGLSDGTIKCWGKNYNGQLGNGTYINSNTPVSVHSSLHAFLPFYKNSYALLPDNKLCKRCIW